MSCSAGAQAAESLSAEFTASITSDQGVQTATDTVAVMPFTNATNETGLDWLSTGISETITSDLLTLGGFVVVERLQLWMVMEEQALQLTGAVSDETVVEIGKLLGADYLIVGAFQKMGDTIRLTARFVEAESGSIRESAKVTGRIDDVFDLQDQIVCELAVHLKQDEASTKAVISQPDPTRSIDAFRHFGQATLLEAGRDYPGAIAELQEALALDPDFVMARERLAEVWWPLREGNSWQYHAGATTAELDITFPDMIWSATGLIEFEGRMCAALTAVTDVGRVESTEFYRLGEAGVEHVGSRPSSSAGEETSKLFNPPRLMFPLDLEIGMEWETQAMTWLVEEERGSGQIPYHHSVTGIEPYRMTGAGTLQCFVIRMEPLIPGSGVIQTWWFTPGVGVVRWIEGDTSAARPTRDSIEFLQLGTFSFEADITFH
ncbi:CsgG/HfaB family protein [Gemmatimonadota bacterium]